MGQGDEAEKFCPEECRRAGHCCTGKLEWLIGKKEEALVNAAQGTRKSDETAANVHLICEQYYKDHPRQDAAFPHGDHLETDRKLKEFLNGIHDGSEICELQCGGR